MKFNIENLRCEYLCDPLGIDELNPRLSWEMGSGGLKSLRRRGHGGQAEVRGQKQTAYHVLVASSEELLQKGQGDLWDSGKIASADSTQIDYKGKKLASFQFCFWKVKIWDANGVESGWSDTAEWSMGLLESKDWQGKWISYPVGMIKDSPFFRKDFAVNKKLKRAMLYATAKGLYEAYINGKKVGNDVFTPGWTDYRKRLYYNTYDVTGMLETGKNAIGSVIGDGWFKGPVGFTGQMNCYGSFTQCLLNLRLEYTDGSVEIISTDETWKTSTGPILQSTFLWGEHYDARQELGAWSTPGYNDAKWKPVHAIGMDQLYWDDGAQKQVRLPELLQAYPCETVKCTEILKTIDLWQSAPGSWIFDLGQNFAGRIKLKIKGKVAQMVRLRFGEMVNPDKTLYVENLRGAISTDTYICKGKGTEEWEAKFTFHGFRYVEVSGLTSKPGKDTITGLVLGSATTRVGRFSCSDPLVNQLYSNLVWTQRANFLEVPTDCPQRDERLGWTGDAQAYIRTAICNMDIAAFFKKWLVDLEDTQEADGSVANIAPSAIKIVRADSAWGDAITICPWTIYQCYGDVRILQKHYSAMAKWVAYLESTSDKLIRGKTHCFGDWLSINADTPKELIQTAFFAYSAKLMANSAKVLKKSADAKKYEKLFEDIKRAFIKKYVKKDGRVFGDTQTAYVLALHFDLLPQELVAKAVKHLVANLKKKKDHLSTGFVGTPYLLHVLTKFGHLDLAYKLLLNKTYPSWLYSVVNGATTIWERWNGWKDGEGCGDANMNSFSHYAYGSVGEWMFNTVAGIDCLEPAFRKIKFNPRPGKGIDQAAAEYNSIYGKVSSSWTLKKEVLKLDVAIPPNTTAEVVIPTGKKKRLTESGVEISKAAGIKVIAENAQQITLEIGSGNFKFISE